MGSFLLPAFLWGYCYNFRQSGTLDSNETEDFRLRVYPITYSISTRTEETDRPLSGPWQFHWEKVFGLVLLLRGQEGKSGDVIGCPNSCIALGLRTENNPAHHLAVRDSSSL